MVCVLLWVHVCIIWLYSCFINHKEDCHIFEYNIFMHADLYYKNELLNITQLQLH